VIVVSDTSVLSCLAELGELSLLHQLYGVVTVTETIRREACHHHAPESLRRWFANPPAWLVIVEDPFPLLEETLVLDSGEASAITLAWLHRDSCLLLIDERLGRSLCAALGLRVTGAAGILTDAAAADWIDFDDAFRRLAGTRFRLGETVVATLRQRLRQAGS